MVNHGGSILSPVAGLVVHVQEGNGSLWGWFNNPASQVSSHFWVSKTGIVEQYVDAAYQAWTQAAGNASYLSVETEGFDTEPFTAPQLAALVALWGWVRTAYGLPNQTVDHGGRGLTTHAHYPSGQPDPAWGGHPCPGLLRAADLPTIVAGQPSPTPTEEPEMLIAAHPTAEGYWLAKPDGSVFAFGAAKYHGGGNALGTPPGSVKMAAPATGMAATPTGNGYWLIDAQGHVYAFGDATWLGNTT